MTTTRETLRALVADVLRRDADALATGRLCPRCGSGGHGRPWARTADGPLHVSLSYAVPSGLAVVVWSPRARVGVDVVAADAVPPDGLDPAGWAEREALGKLRGTGLVPTPAPAGCDERVVDLDAPRGLVARLALAGADATGPLDTGAVEVRWVTAPAGGRAGPCRPARP